MTKIIENFSKFKYNRFNPSVNEWLNSIYNFDKNNLNMLWSNKIISDIINNYFNIKPKKISFFKEVNNKFPLKRVFVSVPEIKNSNNNNNVFVYIFNKEKLIFNKKINKLQKIYHNNRLFGDFTLNTKTNDLNIISNNNVNYSNNELFKNFNIANYVKIYINTFLESFNSKINNDIIKALHIKIYDEFFQKENPNLILYKKNFENNLTNENFYIFAEKKLTELHEIINIKYYILFFYKRFITKLYFNKIKFNSINLFNLNKIFYKIYNKRVNINIINLKYLHLDNSLFTNAVIRKLKRKKSKLLKVLRKALILPKIPDIDSMFLLRKENERKENKINDVINNLVNFNKFLNIENINKVIFESLKNIHVIGVRLEGKGRLTRKVSASRSVYKKTYKGNLKNIYSSSKGLSAAMSRGFKSNLNYINLNSSNINGSYGIKSWHNTM